MSDGQSKAMAGGAAEKRPRVLHIVTSPLTTRLMTGQLRTLREAGFDVYIVSAPGPELEAVAAAEGVNRADVPMEREMSPLRDLRSLGAMWRLMRRLRPTIVNVGTAKAGLLGGLAARLARVPCRVYTLHGLRLETTTGLKRRLLMTTERISCRCSQRVLCVSESVRRRAVEIGLVNRARTVLLGAGSFNGIDLVHFAPTPERRAAAAELRRELGIAPEAPVIGFIGRLTRDKGVPELVAAFRAVRERRPSARLLLVGRYETGDPVPDEVRQFIDTDPGVLHAGYVSDPSVHYHVMDVFALPTYREGFPTVVLEAAASGKPVVSTFATGAVDATVDGETGLLVPVGDAEALAGALCRLLEQPAWAAQMGAAARARVERDFQQTRVWGELVALYRSMLAEQGLALAWLGPPPGGPLARAVRRGADLLGATLGLVLAAPLMAAAALGVRLTMGAPVLFRQRRAGLYGRPFTVLKLRTMREARDADGRPRPDEERMTSLGRLLRRFSIDELPQLWNVVKGEMSLVGPRPLLPEYLSVYTEQEQKRHRVRPGLTGYAQVRGRHTLRFSERLTLDSWYVEHWSPWLDAKILLATVPTALWSKHSVARQEEEVDDRGFTQYLEDSRAGRGQGT